MKEHYIEKTNQLQDMIEKHWQRKLPILKYKQTVQAYISL